ncbi:hypothetical protein E2C01_058702 [Portunus trituberculatus]|uniref:Uncharacterized protein n=1 Tax=Portunus trituberculatus TaxID=210409 RepID=A0A5B7H6W2_PORTR|nr:hypothetical protein [Portunus trituberculatus]
MNKWNIKGHHRRQKKRETSKKNLCVAWTSKLLENVSVVSKKLWKPWRNVTQILPGVAKCLMT